MKTPGSDCPEPKPSWMVPSGAYSAPPCTMVLASTTMAPPADSGATGVAPLEAKVMVLCVPEAPAGASPSDINR